jgi:hypothetical protein
MNLVSTMIMTFDNQLLVVPNNKIWGDVIRNITHQETRRIDMTFGIGYSDDIAKAERVLTEIVTSHEQVPEDPAPMMRLLLRLLVRRGLLCDDAGDGLDESQVPSLHTLSAASVRQRVAMGRRAGATVLRLGDAPTVKVAPPKGRRQARLGGFDLHANTSVRGKNRSKLERLCRYLLRPPVAEDRLFLASDGSVNVRLKTPWRAGTSYIALQPLELLEKLAALIPRPYVNLIVYHGVLAPNAKWRREVVDFGRPRLERPSLAMTSKKIAAPHNRTWAELMRRGLEIDVLECPDCGGRLRFVAAILLSSATPRILLHIGLPSDPVQLAPARAPAELDDAWAC